MNTAALCDCCMCMCIDVKLHVRHSRKPCYCKATKSHYEGHSGMVCNDMPIPWPLFTCIDVYVSQTQAADFGIFDAWFVSEFAWNESPL